jgi:hypothetical protein
MHRDLKHQTDNDVAHIRTIKDQGDSTSVDGRTNDSNAEMMINAIRPRTFFNFSVSDYCITVYIEGDFGGGNG